MNKYHYLNFILFGKIRWMNYKDQAAESLDKSKISYWVNLFLIPLILFSFDTQAQNNPTLPFKTVQFQNIIQNQNPDDYLNDRLYVAYNTNVPVFWGTNFKISPTEFLEFKDIAAEYGITEVENTFYFAQHEVLKRTLTIKFTESNKIDQLISKLSESSRLQLVEKVPACTGTLIPNDPSYSGQWHLSHINAATAWNTTTGSSSIDVAVVDDAIEIIHPDLSSNITTGRDVAWNTNNPSPPTSSYAHGTHVAGIVGAQSNNGLGVASIGYNIDIMPIKASDGTPAPNGGVYITHGYPGITWAAQNGAEIINASWGGSGCSTCQTVITNAWNLGAIVVAAAGNSNTSTPMYPAAYSNVIAVASSANTSDARSSFSNYGSWVDITAPGSSILSTTLGGTYQSWDGTSMASPMVAGLLGLVWSVNTSATRASVINCVTSTAVPLTWSGGSGRINAAAAVQCMSGGGGGGGSLPDLDYAGSGATLTVNGTIVNISFPVKNVGTAAAGSSTLKYYLSTDAIFTVSDYEIGSDPVAALAPGATSIESISVDVSTVSPAIPAGTYYVGLIIDATNVVTESDETNNPGGWWAPQVTITGGGGSLPDLAYAGSGANLVIHQGPLVIIGMPVTNIGTGSAGSSTLKYYLSTDSIITLGDYEIGSDIVPALVPGASSTPYIVVNVSTLSPAIPAGTYYVGTLMDAAGVVTESNESNNSRYWLSPQVTITGSGSSLPDLTYAATGSNLTVNGTVVNITLPVTNIGAGSAGSSTLKYYLSTNTIISAADYEIGSDFVSALAAGASSTESITVDVSTVSPSIPVGTYYVGVLIDAGGAVTESNESNNSRYWLSPQVTLGGSSNYCSGTTNLTSASGSFSDGSGASSYNNNADCKWLIQPSGATSITLSFSSFALETCCDYVRIYDGTTTSAPLLGSFNGTSLPPSITSTGGDMLVHFTTDGSVTAAGWSASYTSTTGGGGGSGIVIGTSLDFNTTSEACPINIWYRSLRYQTVYTAAELSAAGATAGNITELGWNVLSVPSANLPNYTISIKHTTASDASAHDGTGLSQVYNNTLYAPTAGGFDMLTFQAPFNWNGIDNILIDVCFDQVTAYNASGVVAMYSATNSARYVRSDVSSQCGASTNASLNKKPQVKLTMSGGGGTTCATPTGLSSTNITTSSATLNWSSVTGASLYNVQWRVSSASTWNNGNTTATNFVPLSITAGTTYQWRVRTDCGSTTSAWSSIQTFTTLSNSFLTVSPGNISPTNAAGNTSIAVSSNVSWTASESVSWLTISGGSGSNNGSFTINHTANTSTSPRTATVTVSGAGVSNQTITVTQAGATVTNFLTVSPSSISPTSSAGNTSIAVSSNVSWTASESISWLTISGGSGSNNGLFTINHTANNNAGSRTATVTVSGSGVSNQTVTVTQAGSSTTPPYTWIPTNQSGVFQGQAQVTGIGATSSDWIAAIDQNGNTAGATQIIVNAGIGYINLPIYGDDPTTPSVDEGMSAGEYFTLQLYDASTGTYRDYPTSATKFQFTQWSNTNGTPIAGYDNPSTVYNFLETVSDTINLNPGWNLVSTDVIPTDSTISSVFASLISSNNLIYVTGFDNGTKFYDPNGLSFFNTLNHMKRGLGVWVKVTNAATLVITGDPILSSYKSNLNAGWNLVSFIPQTQESPSTYYSNLVNSNNLIYVTGFDNGTQFYDPNGLSFFNTLQFLRNSFGYWVKVNTSVGGNSYRGDGFLPTNIYNFFNGSSNLEEYVNEEVNIYTQSGELCGKLVILENGYLMTTSVYGDDALTTIIDGVPVGEGLLFEFRGQMLDVGITFNGDMGHHYLDLQFDTDALTGTDMIGEYLMAFSCYPNPFSSTLNISYTLTETTETVVRVHNALGQEVEVIKNEQAVAGEHIVQWDASQELLGLYFISLEINGQVVTTQKVLLRR